MLITQMKQWVKNALGSWSNCIYLRLDSYGEYDNPCCLFWEELNSGYYCLRDEWIMSQPGLDPYNLSGRDPYYTYTMRSK